MNFGAGNEGEDDENCEYSNAQALRSLRDKFGGKEGLYKWLKDD